jgi:hypothetical protein
MKQEDNAAAPDPIFAAIAKYRRQRAIAEAADKRIEAIGASLQQSDPDGYRQLNEMFAEAWNASGSACEAAMNTSATTIAGALARLELAAEVIKESHAQGGVFDPKGMNFELVGVLGALEDLRRLLAVADAGARFL